MLLIPLYLLLSKVNFLLIRGGRMCNAVGCKNHLVKGYD
jgi:hypothetical protein